MTASHHQQFNHIAIYPDGTQRVVRNGITVQQIPYTPYALQPPIEGAPEVPKRGEPLMVCLGPSREQSDKTPPPLVTIIGRSVTATGASWVSDHGREWPCDLERHSGRRPPPSPDEPSFHVLRVLNTHFERAEPLSPAAIAEAHRLRRAGDEGLKTALAQWLRTLAYVVEGGHVVPSDVAQALFNKGNYTIECPLSEAQNGSSPPEVDSLVAQIPDLYPGRG